MQQNRDFKFKVIFTYKKNQMKKNLPEPHIW